MRSMTIVLSERAYRALSLYSDRTGRSMEELAEAAVENEISQTREWDDVLPPPRCSDADERMPDDTL